MELKNLICPACGAPVKAEGEKYRCNHCGLELTPDYSEELASLQSMLDNDKQEKLANARRNLYECAHEEIVNSEKILTYAREVKLLFPDDYLARFYEVANGDNLPAINAFLDKTDVTRESPFLQEIIPFMIKSLEKRNVNSLKSLVDRAHIKEALSSGEYTEYVTKIEEEAEKLDDGMYTVYLPRDVFVAYSSRDMAEVGELVDYLEGEGLTCFVALRNLRHGRGSAENYEKNLETAMRNCKSLVFVSTENSRDLACDALRVEIPYLRENKPDIYRVEYRPASDSGKTSRSAKILLEDFFANLEYARTKEDVFDRLIKHELRMDSAAATSPAPAQRQAPVPQAPAENLSAQECYEKGLQCERGKEAANAVKWYRRAVEEGHARAQYKLGECYKKGFGVAQNDTEAAKWFQKAADQGNASAQYCLGVCYQSGRGVGQDDYEAVKWYRRSALQGYAEAQNNLGYCYKNGQGVAKDDAEAVKWYQKAAEKGNVSAQFNLGVCYKNGQGVAKDDAEAVKWYQRATEQGDADAQFNLGYCYAHGQGVTKSDAEAVKLYQRAAAQGHAGAQCNLGNCYAHGQGVGKNDAEAVKWYQKAAAQGNVYAQSNLGHCYEGGIGIGKDAAEAKKWYQKAAEQGYSAAQEALKRLGA